MLVVTILVAVLATITEIATLAAILQYLYFGFIEYNGYS